MTYGDMLYTARLIVQSVELAERFRERPDLRAYWLDLIVEQGTALTQAAVEEQEEMRAAP